MTEKEGEGEAGVFRAKRGIKASYERQGYIYFVSRLYKDLSEQDRRRIRELCKECGGEHYRALFEFVTTDTTATALALKHYLSKKTLYRAVRRYYENFPEKL